MRRRCISTHGSATWSDESQLIQAGLYQGDGVILGRTQQGYLRASGDGHVLVAGPSRSGKDISSGIPTLLSWPHSVLCLDIKGDSAAITDKYRGTLGRVYRFAPASRTEGEAINPLDSIRSGTIAELDDADRLGLSFAATGARSTAISEYWRDEAAGVLSTVFLYMRHQSTYPATCDGARQFMAQPIPVALQALRGSGHPVLQQDAQDLRNMTRQELAQVWRAAARLLRPWRSRLLAHHTRATTIPWESLATSETPMTIYLQVTADDLQGRLRRVFRVLMELMLGRLTEGIPDAAHPRRPILVLLNEFARLGSLDVLKSAISLAAGYQIRFLLMLQSIEQLWDAYGKYSGILGNCATKVIFATDEEESSEYFSRLIGDATVEEDVRSLTGPRWGLFWRQRGRQGQRHARRLLTPDELRRLPKDRAVLLAPGLPPALIHKVRYYDDPNWQRRAA